MHSLVASTSDTIRIWDLGVSDANKQQSTNARQHSRFGSTGIVSDDGSGHTHVSTEAVHKADSSTDGIGQIASVSWAADGNTLAVAGKGTSIRQYGRTGELLQNIKPNPRTEQTNIMEVAAVRHYGSSSEALFIANNTKRQVRRWDFVRKEFTTVCQTHENKISCMAVCTKKRMVATATAQGGEIGLFNLLHNTRTDLRSATRKALTCIDIAFGHKSQVAVGSEEGLLQLFDTARSGAAPLRSFSQTHFAPIRGVAFHPLNNSTLISAGLDGRVVITDTSDSMMEMFTPEPGAKPADSIPQMLVSQLLNNKHPTQGEERSVADVQTTAAISDVAHHPAISATSEPPERHISSAVPSSSSKQGPMEAATRSISSSVFQNAISDALAPVCEQIRGEIRNLHLDILRQGFVYQEQVRALRQECGEARVLRQEIEQLRRENEQLRRYIPFFAKEPGHTNNDSWDKF
ncbi:hypothetical protein H4R20_005684 [Coemansia guatemalensis]|uniref:WD40 repeat-like protein n=1 Tax=Coemansia guatemalensis TaxID=2761395 RepID=A0A9W8HPW4_9FUNG|nr:hypothetical protein H4R20_005684 [Coemansia guatemalensis]